MASHAEFASDDIKQLLIENGLRDLDDAVTLGRPLDGARGRRANRHVFKRVVQWELKAPSGPIRAYIKCQWKRGRWFPNPTDARRRIGVKCSPIHEWRGLRIMQNAGLHVAEPLAVFWKGWGFTRGAIVTRAVPAEYSIADLILRGELQAMESERRNALIDAVTAVVAQLQRARICWKSMKAKHFYPERTADGDWRIWLIDCESVSPRIGARDGERQWKAFLKFITREVPALDEAFRSAYLAHMNSCDKNVGQQSLQGRTRQPHIAA